MTMMRLRTLNAYMATTLFSCIATTCAHAEIAFTARALTQSARAGIPVVVEVGFVNNSPDPHDIVELIDPYLVYVTWTWTSGSTVFEVGVKDLHCALREPLPPRKQRLASNERLSWYYTIPTPASFGHAVPWTLRATLQAAVSPSGQDVVQEISYHGSDLSVSRLAHRIGSTWAQATLIAWHSEEVLHQLDRMNLLPEIEYCFREGDRQAEMLLFSRSLLTAKDVLKLWQGLDNAPDEMLCLRNYLLLIALRDARGHLRRDQIVLLSPDEEVALRKTLKLESFFAKELDVALQSARANAARFAN